MIKHPDLSPQWATPSHETPRASGLYQNSYNDTPPIRTNSHNVMEDLSPNTVYSSKSQPASPYQNRVQYMASGAQYLSQDAPLMVRHQQRSQIPTRNFQPTYTPESSSYIGGNNMAIQLSQVDLTHPSPSNPYGYGVIPRSDRGAYPDSSSELGRMIVSPPFKPSRMSLQQQGYHLLLGPRHATAGNTYMGEPSADKVHKLPDELNGASFVTNIPKLALPWEIFDRIHTGPVACLSMRPENDQHDTAAATLVFMEPEGAKLLLESEIRIQGQLLGSRYNRDGYLANYRRQSRVLIIEGPKEMMTRHFWETYFFGFCSLEWDRILDHPTKDKRRHMMEFRFVRVEGQSRMCLLGIHRDPAFRGVVRAWYGCDPCAAYDISTPTGDSHSGF